MKSQLFTESCLWALIRPCQYSYSDWSLNRHFAYIYWQHVAQHTSAQILYHAEPVWLSIMVSVMTFASCLCVVNWIDRVWCYVICNIYTVMSYINSLLRLRLLFLFCSCVLSTEITIGPLDLVICIIACLKHKIDSYIISLIIARRNFFGKNNQVWQKLELVATMGK